MSANSVISRIFGVVIVGVALVSCSSPQSSDGRKELETTAAAIKRQALKPTGQVETGKASWYSVRTNGGTRTASGERLRNDAATAAHRTFPMGTMVKVTNLRNGRSQIVKITDRGPFIKDRIIDVTIGTAESLDMVKSGVVPCKVERLAVSQ
jgi:rare lipoprotein A